VLSEFYFYSFIAETNCLQRFDTVGCT